MIEQQVSRSKGLDESTRNTLAIGLWIVVFAGLAFLNVHGQSKLMTAGFILLLTGAYSTFLLCEKQKYGVFVHGVPYVFAFAGAMLLCLAPSFHNAVEASLAFLAVTALMHGSVIYDMRKHYGRTGKIGFISGFVLRRATSA